MTDADRYHIPPAASTFENASSPLNQRCGQLARPQAFVDLEPLIRHFESELTRERNAAVEARYDVSRHRERIAELEAKLEHARRDAKDAQQTVADLLADERQRTQVPRVDLTPGSTAAVIEAYRLLCGHEPVHDGVSEWVNSNRKHESLPPGKLHEHAYDAALAILEWLDDHAPGGKP
jgi:hypothetical protein